MVVPVIAVGVYELLAAGAAATGLGAVAVAKRRELAEGLNDAADAAQDALRDTTLQALPYIIGAATGHSLWRPRALPDVADIGSVKTLPLPGFADAAAWDGIGVPVFGAVAAVTATQAVTRITSTGIPLTDVSTSPSDPGDLPPSDPFKKIHEGLGRVGNAITQHPLFKVYQYLNFTYAFFALCFPSEENGPLLYDKVWKPLVGESAKARAFLGLMEVVATESSGGALAVTLARRIGPHLPAKISTMVLKHLPSFAQINLGALIGGPSFYQYQMTANGSSAHDVDVTRASRNAFFLGFTSTIFYPLKDMIIARFGGVKFANWWRDWGAAARPEQLFSRQGANWVYARFWRGTEVLFGKTISNWLRPDFVPSAETLMAYAAFITVFRNAVQAATSLVPGLEKSNVQESLVVTNTRNLWSIPTLDLRFALGSASNNLSAQLVNQLAFMVYIDRANQYSSPFDGKDVAVDEAKRAILKAPTDHALIQAVRGKPLTDRTFFGAKSRDLAEKTWAQLADEFARDVHAPRQWDESLPSIDNNDLGGALLIRKPHSDEFVTRLLQRAELTMATFDWMWRQAQTRIAHNMRSNRGAPPDLRLPPEKAWALLRIYDTLAKSYDVDDCQIRLSIWTLLTHVAYTLPEGLAQADRTWRMTLREELVRRNPRLEKSPYAAGPEALEKVFDYINGHVSERCLPTPLPL